jgi:hypothetical protein
MMTTTATAAARAETVPPSHIATRSTFFCYGEAAKPFGKVAQLHLLPPSWPATWLPQQRPQSPHERVIRFHYAAPSQTMYRFIITVARLAALLPPFSAQNTSLY